MIAIIPARGGSKGVPGKNIKSLCNKPLIAYSIEAALSSELVDRVIVSTDCNAIAEVAKKYGAEIPFMRPSELAQDKSLAIDNYIYTMNRLNENMSHPYQEFIVLQPTSPLRTSKDVDESIKLFFKMKANSVISVTEAEHPVTWYKKIDSKGCLKEYCSYDSGNKNRQEIEQAYIPNGAIYIFNLIVLKKTLNYYSDRTYAYIMPHNKSLDIDNYFDFEFAEFLMSRNAVGKMNDKSGVKAF